MQALFEKNLKKKKNFGETRFRIVHISRIKGRKGGIDGAFCAFESCFGKIKKIRKAACQCVIQIESSEDLEYNKENAKSEMQ